jgi:hypothetical protein
MTSEVAYSTTYGVADILMLLRLNMASTNVIADVTVTKDDWPAGRAPAGHRSEPLKCQGASAVPPNGDPVRAQDHQPPATL